MTIACFLTIAGIEGEAVASGHEGEIDVLAWSWGMANSGTTHVVGPRAGGAGRARVNDLSVSKSVDKATARLMRACLSGERITECSLSCYPSGVGADDAAFLRITMTDCLVTSVGSAGQAGDERFEETLALNSAKVQVEYRPQDPPARPGSAEKMRWNIANNAHG